MELTLNEALQKGIEAQKAGNFQEADMYYTAVLKAQPKHPEANHNIGVIGANAGKFEDALPFFKTALEVNSNVDQFWLSYIDTLMKLKRIDDAKAAFDQAKSKGLKGDKFDNLELLLSGRASSKSEGTQELPQNQSQALISFYGEGQFQKVFKETQRLPKVSTRIRYKRHSTG